MADNLLDNITTAAKAANEKLGAGAEHDDIVTELGSQLNDLGTSFQFDAPAHDLVPGQKADLDVTDGGKVVAHIKIKTGECHGDPAQMKRFQESKHNDLYVIMFKGDGSDPCVKKV